MPGRGDEVREPLAPKGHAVYDAETPPHAASGGGDGEFATLNGKGGARQFSATTTKNEHEVKSAMLVTMGIFMGYSALNALQRKIKLRLGIPDDGSDASIQFSFACSFLYMGNLVFRLAHNIIFFWLRPRHRVFLAMGCMCCAMSVIGFGIFLGGIKHIGLVFLAYSLGGVAVGSFESNVLSALSPLGHATKGWAVQGIPIGYNVINIGSFVMLSIVPDNHYMQFAQYMIVIVGLLGGMFVFHNIEDFPDTEGSDTPLTKFKEDIRQFRVWGWFIKWNALALMIDMAGVSMFSAIAMYIFDNKAGVPLLGGDSTLIMHHNTFLAVYNCCTFLGDTLSRKLVYWQKGLFHPLWYVLLTGAGACMCLSKVAILAWPGIFLVFFANGSIYATSTKHIDEHCRRRSLHDYTLIALSVWLFVGDVGSVTGSNLVAHVKEWIGPVQCTHC